MTQTTATSVCDGSRTPRVYNIAAGAAFLPALADAILSGVFEPGGESGDDPLRLARMTILLPTRRSVRALTQILSDRFDDTTVLLPTIRPIDSVDDDGATPFALNEAPVGDAAARLECPPAIDPLERRLALTRLALGWYRLTRADRLRHSGGIAIPAGPADAVHLAGDLEALLDTAIIEQVPWSRLPDLVPDDYAEYWQLTLQFLAIVTRHWPDHLAEHGAVDAATRRDMLIRAEAGRLRQAGARGSIVAAGSTGSIPATRDLLEVIASLPNGAVVLPGLDRHMDDGCWASLGAEQGPDAEPSLQGHPQFGLKQLLDGFGMDRRQVLDLEPTPASLANRVHVLSEALRPIEATDAWARFSRDGDRLDDALTGLALLEARSEQEEALGIALALRQALHDGVGQAALVTPDRVLARRVAAELRRWKIDADDSAGTRLADTPPGRLVELVAKIALTGLDAETVLALLKHPLCRLGQPPGQARHAARLLERAALRGPVSFDGIHCLAEHVGRNQSRLADPNRYPSRAQAGLTQADWRRALDLAAALDRSIAPLNARADGENWSVGELANALTLAVQAVATDELGQTTALYSGNAGDALFRFLSGLCQTNETDLSIAAGEAADFISALVESCGVSPAATAEGRVHIWGTLESRLQSVDLAVLGGLNEGTWPAETALDPWLSRTMRRQLGLSAPERRLGLSAHDFVQAACQPRVLLTRSLKLDGAPTVASRWLQRLLALAGPERRQILIDRAACYQEWSGSIDRAGAAVEPARRPEPRPPVRYRPRKLSVTAVETWIRDPYAIYARHILKLHPLEPVAAEPGPADRGTLIHEILGRFTQQWSGPFDEPASQELIRIGAECFDEWRGFDEVETLWWPRFQRLAEWFVRWSAVRQLQIDAVAAEIPGELAFDSLAGPFKLTARADRIECLGDGSLAVLDYKTGQVPSHKQVSSVLAPQLPLEAAIAAAGGYTPVARGPIADFGYVRLTGGQPAGIHTWLGESMDVGNVTERAVDKLSALIRAYDDEDLGYLSRARVLREAYMDGDYDHLARVREWAITQEDDEL